jgi:hypothetical protein
VREREKEYMWVGGCGWVRVGGCEFGLLSLSLSLTHCVCVCVVYVIVCVCV